ncbi:MAG: aldo/keto reductase [Verrucomicrobiota bacterium]
MQYTRLGRTEMRVSEVSLGAMQINGKPGFKGAEEGDEGQSLQAIRTAVAECGVNFIDTARWYHQSQHRIAKALDGMEGGDDVLIASKVSPETDEKAVLDQVEVCLRDLRRDHIDLMQIHSGTNQEKREATVPVLQGLRDKGLIRFIGVTMGYGPRVPEQAMLAIESGVFDAIQLHVNVLHPHFSQDILPAAKRQDIGTIAMNPQCGGYLAKRCPDPARFDLSFLTETGINSLHEAALKWCVSLPCLDVAIPGSRNPEHIRRNCSVSDGRYLTDEQMRQLEELLANQIDTSEDWRWNP